MRSNAKEKKRIAVYFNNEYIGDIDSFKVERATESNMSVIYLKGDYYAQKMGGIENE